MERRKTAVALAIAMAVSGLAFGMAGGNVAASSASDCAEDFFVKDGKSTAQPHSISPDETLVGQANVSSTASEDLRIEVQDTDLTRTEEVEVGKVFYLEDGECQDYKGTTDPCSQIVSDGDGETTLCHLDAPSDGEREYYIPFMNNQSQTNEFLSWTV